MADLSKDQVVDYLSNLPVIQIAELIKTLEDKWGVKAAPVAVAGVAGPAAAGPALRGGRLRHDPEEHAHPTICEGRLQSVGRYPHHEQHLEGARAGSGMGGQHDDRDSERKLANDHSGIGENGNFEG